jgi:hypothetical protein
MIFIALVSQIILNLVITNTIYSVELIKFSNLYNSFGPAFIFETINVEEVINFNYLGIDEVRFESIIEELVKTNVTSTPLKISYHYYNDSNLYCAPNQCDSVQFKIENLNSYVRLTYEFNYQIRKNYG